MESHLTRRRLLRSAAVLTSMPLMPKLAFGVPEKGTTHGPAPVRLGIASYTFRKFNQAQLIDFMKTLRTPYLNLKEVHLPMGPADQVGQAAEPYRKAGLELTAAGTIYFPKDDDDDIRSKFEYVKAAGIPLIVGAPTRVTLPRVERFVKQYDIRLAIHNHGPEDKEWPSPLDVLSAVKNMDPRIGCCIDVGHTMRAGTDVVDAIHKAGPRLFDLHMKDLANATEKESQVAVGEGIMPVRAIFQALIDMHYAGAVDLEYEIKADDPMPGVMESFAYLRGVLSGMGYAG